MTAPIIPTDQWPEWANRHCWDAEGSGMFFGVERTGKGWVSEYGYSNIPMPVGHDWRVPAMRPSEQAPAIDLEQGLRDLYRAYVRLLESGRDRIKSLGGDCDPVDVMEQTDIDLRKVRDLLAQIDGQANVRSSSEHSDSLTPVARRKLQGLQAEGFIVNGVAIFNPTTGRRGLVDYLGYVGWQTSEQPTKGEGE